MAPSASAPVEVRITFSSTVTPGRLEGSDPVAITTWVAEWTASPTCTCPGTGIEAQPLSQVTLFFLNRNSMPRVLPVTTSSL